MTATIHSGCVFDVLPTMERGSVDICVTSPPYWMLRSYLPKDHPLKHLELGSEKTPAEFVSNMVRVFGLVREVMTDYGTCWLNIGDSYSAGSRVGHGTRITNKQATNAGTLGFDERPNPPGVESGNLCLIPQRLTLALQADGWIVRSVIIWRKPSAMPASISGWRWMRCRVKVASGNKYKNSSAAMTETDVGFRLGDATKNAEWTDCPGCKKCEPTGYVLRRGSWRPTSSYEPILMLAKTDRYFADGEAVKTKAAPATISRNQYTRILDDPDEQFAVAHDHESNQTTANLRDVWHAKLADMSQEELIEIIEEMDDGSMQDVWSIPAEPLRAKHFAAFPTALAARCIKAGTSSRGYCPSCNAPWARIIESVDTGRTQKMADGWNTGEGAHGSIHPNGSEAGESGKPVMENRTIGWRQTCRCPPHEPRCGRVLDPFCGSGRTMNAAQLLDMDFVGCELNPEYVALAKSKMRTLFS